MLLGGWFAWNHHRQSSSAASITLSSSDWQKRTPAPARKIVDRPAPVASRPEAVPLSPPAAAPPEIATDATGEAGIAAASLPGTALIELYYRGLFRRLHFTPEQVSVFQNLQDAAFNDALNALPPAERDRLMNNPAAMRQMMFASDMGVEVDNRVLQQFGDVVSAQYKQDMQTFPQRIIVDQFDQTLRSAGSELSDEQASQLVQILAHNEQTGTKPETNRFSPDALAAAAAVLSAEQFQALQQFQAAQPPPQP